MFVTPLESLKSIIYFSFGGHSTICSLNAVYIIGKENYSSVSDDCILYLVNKKGFVLFQCRRNLRQEKYGFGRLK